MACDRQLAPNQTLQQRMSEVERALKRLEQYISSGTVRIQIGPTGSIVFVGWNDRDRLSDTCAYRSLSLANSWALRQAVARAEATSGRKVNERAVTAGHHSHDGGGSWHKGH